MQRALGARGGEGGGGDLSGRRGRVMSGRPALVARAAAAAAVARGKVTNSQKAIIIHVWIARTQKWCHSSSRMLVGPFCGLGPAISRAGTPACDPNWSLDRQNRTLAHLLRYPVDLPTPRHVPYQVRPYRYRTIIDLLHLGAKLYGKIFLIWQRPKCASGPVAQAACLHQVF